MEQAAVESRKTGTKAAVAVVITMLLWASAFVGIRYAGAYFTPGALALGRLLTGAAGLGVIMVIRGEGLPPRAAWPGIIGVGVFWFGLYTVALNWGEKHADAGTAALIVGMGPILLALLSGWVLKEGFPRQLLTGLAVAFAGAAVVGLSTGNGATTILGVVLCLVAAIGYAIGVVTQKIALLKHASALQVTTFGCTVGAVACLPFAGQLADDLAIAPLGSTLAMVYLGLLPTALAFYTWAYALTRSPAGRLGATTYMVPVLVVLLSWLLLGEVPTPIALLGGALTLVGVAVSRMKRKS
ncbi:DMT family transporter [Saccharopolyspora phatthalungensis]|uniref:Drug/metabolite transporter (DMT)-like permease n=1 Tax=Saccharopolyspora phatthalungensis TaxID=664693 RepID=A0A840QKV9_9PSEU|nr:EamA family transporter [Saccharopolyspora phatthalungensis]MBB5159603.1 drug/metabolite transporter (DMT)-like permease [Saccharopolyspora phatthalungensis]